MHPKQSSSFLAQLGQSLRQPEFWAYSSWLDLVTKNRRTRLGMVWLVVPTLMFLLVLGNFYSSLMGYSAAEYLPYLGVGYVCWRFLIQCVNDSSSVFRTHKAFIMDGRVRLTDFILRCIAKALFNFTFAFVVVIGILAWSPAVEWSGLASLIITLPVLLANIVWLSLCIGLIGARFPDTSEFIHTILVVGFLLTPILWHVEKFPSGTVRGFLARLNPAFHLIEVVRAPALGHMPEYTSIVAVGVMTLAGWIAAMFLYRRYARFVPLWI